MTQDHNTLPIYAQVAQTLMREIAAGRLVDGERLPAEREMAKELAISVGTLRKALDRLQQDGLLERIQGSGNYIRASGVRDNLYAMFRLERPKGGGFPTAQLLTVEVCSKPTGIADIGTSTNATRIRRLRHLDDVAVALEEIWLDADCGTLAADDLSHSLYQTYQSKLGLWISRVEDRVSLGHVPDWRPDKFSLGIGESLGYVERLSWADKPNPVEFSRTWFDPERAVYVQRLK